MIFRRKSVVSSSAKHGTVYDEDDHIGDQSYDEGSQYPLLRIFRCVEGALVITRIVTGIYIGCLYDPYDSEGEAAKEEAENRLYHIILGLGAHLLILIVALVVSSTISSLSIVLLVSIPAGI